MPLAVFWPFLSRLKAYYGEHFWSQPTWVGATASYAWFFNTANFALGIEVAAVCMVAVLLSLFPARSSVQRREPQANALFHERVLALGLLGLPILSFLVAKLAHGGMTSRYMLPTVLGFPLAIGYTLPGIGPRMGRKNAGLVLGFALCLLVILVVQESRSWSSYTGHFVSPAEPAENFLSSAGSPSLPVVVSDPNDFLQLAHYASPAWATRFVSIADPEKAVMYVGADSIDKQFKVVRHYAPRQVYDFGPFAAEHPIFLLYSSDGGVDWDWWPRSLLADGYTLQLVAVKDKLHKVFLVSRDKKPE